MTVNPARSRTFGWLMAGVSSAAILSGAAALALAAESREEPAPMMLDLSMMPSTAPNVAAVAEEAPEVMDEVTQQTQPPEMEPPPELDTDTPPDLPVQSAMSLPEIDKPVVADLSLPPPPEEPEPEPEKKVEEVKKAEKKPEKKPEPEKKKEKPKKVETAEKVEKTEKPKDEAQAAAKAGATGAKAGAAKGGSKMSPAAYSKAVLKKINSTRKKKVKSKGVTGVAFLIGKDGSLASVQVIRGSGSAELDQAAVDHIRRSAPFPIPPEGAKRDFQMEIVGK